MHICKSSSAQAVVNGGLAMRNQLKTKTARAFRSLAALVMILCLLTGMLPTAFAAQSVGASGDDVSPSKVKTYIKLSTAVPFFTGVTKATGTVVNPAVGSVCQLVSPDWYTAADGKAYYSVYYLNNRYNVLKSDVEKDILSEAALTAYITGTVWKQTSFTTLRKNMNLEGDVRVHAIQLALKQLGYYKGDLDGSYGNQTHNAIYKFQKDNNLEADGSAGAQTQPVLFAKASGTTISGGSSSGSSSSSSSSAKSGTLRTIASVNLRKYGSTSSARLASIPRNINLSYSDVYTASNGVKWYQVSYAGKTGWVMGTYVSVTSASSSGSSSGSSTTGGIGTLRTSAQVNLRKYASTGSARLAIVPKSTTLAYSDTHVDSKNITWYKVRYNGNTGWLMGTYVNVTGTSGSSSSSGSATGGVAIGTVTITVSGTRVRDAANGNKTGVLLSAGSEVDLLAQPVALNGYTWYNIRTSSGLIGWVRGDCATASIGSTSGSLPASADKTFVKLPAATVLFKTETKPTTGGITVPANTVLMMYSTDTYSVSNVKYCTLYYDNTKYNAVYSEVSGGIMKAEDAVTYMEKLLATALPHTLKMPLDLVGDVRVYALQSALKTLQLYNGKLDGEYGSGTASAVRNFQRSAKLEVDGECGNATWTALYNRLNGVTGTGTVTSFGTVTSIEKASWNYDDDGINLIPKNTYATVLDIETGKVFQVYRWSGAYHADCVPATAADTKIMCDIVGFPYNSNHPTSAQLQKIKADGDEGSPEHTWPDFKNKFGGARNIGSAWDARAALVNVNGKVYPVGIYGFPHGFTGTDSFSSSKFHGGVSNGMYFYAANNYYGMMCLHFVGSKTHSGNVSESRQKAIETAWEYAKKTWPDLCK